MAVTAYQLLKATVDQGGKELHLRVHAPPFITIANQWKPLNTPPLGSEDVRQLVASLLPNPLTEELTTKGKISWGFRVKGLSSFQGHVWTESGGYTALCVRIIPTWLRSARELRLPEAVHESVPTPGLRIISGYHSSDRIECLTAILDEWNRSLANGIAILTSSERLPAHHKKAVMTQIQARNDRELESALRVVFDAVRPTVVAFHGLVSLAAIEGMFECARRGSVVLATFYGRDSIDTIENMRSASRSCKDGYFLRELARLTRWILTKQAVPTTVGATALKLHDLLVFDGKVTEMVAAGRLDNVRKILAAEDPTVGHVCLQNEIDRATRGRRVSREYLMSFLGEERC